VQCKKNVQLSHYISEVVHLPKYFLVFSEQGDEKRVVMPDRIRPLDKKCLYELKGFIVCDEKDINKPQSELTSYFRKDKNNWVKIFNSRKEIEFITEMKMKMKPNQNMIRSNEELNAQLEKVANSKTCGGFPVRFEEQYLHRYVYKALIYKLIGK